MNTMDREAIIALIMGGPDNAGLLFEYCIEMGKEETKTFKFLTMLVMTPYYKRCFNYALDYYQRKFNICILRSKDGRIVKAY